MKTKTYESAVLINAALEDDQIEAVITRISELLTNNGAEIKEVDRWGRKRLAYMVQKSKIGYYAIFRFEAPTTVIAKLERSYVLDEHILRHLTIELDADAVAQLEKNKMNSAAVAEAEAAPKVEEPVGEEPSKEEKPEKE